MPQCNAITKSGKQCLNIAHPMCGGYCRRHFNRKPRLKKGSITARQKAVDFLINSGKLVGAFTGGYEIAKTIIEIAGPFLHAKEIHTILMMKKATTQSEFDSNSRILARSLSRSSVATMKKRAAGSSRISKINARFK